MGVLLSLPKIANYQEDLQALEEITPLYASQDGWFGSYTKGVDRVHRKVYVFVLIGGTTSFKQSRAIFAKRK